jgi:hypothetical protein
MDQANSWNPPPGVEEWHMLASEITGDLPEIIGNEEKLYEGNLILYFRILFYNSNNLKNP